MDIFKNDPARKQANINKALGSSTVVANEATSEVLGDGAGLEISVHDRNIDGNYCIWNSVILLLDKCIPDSPEMMRRLKNQDESKYQNLCPYGKKWPGGKLTELIHPIPNVFVKRYKEKNLLDNRVSVNGELPAVLKKRKNVKLICQLASNTVTKYNTITGVYLYFLFITFNIFLPHSQLPTIVK